MEDVARLPLKDLLSKSSEAVLSLQGITRNYCYLKDKIRQEGRQGIYTHVKMSGLYLGEAFLIANKQHIWFREFQHWSFLDLFENLGFS